MRKRNLNPAYVPLLWGLALLIVALVWGTPVAYADSIGPTCETCQGSIYTLTDALLSQSGGNSTYAITYTIDTTGYTGGGAFINTVAVKVTSFKYSSMPGSFSLVQAPGGVANWTAQAGGLNANGCDGSGAGFLCAQDDHTAPVPKGTYTWVFDITIPTGQLDTGSNGASIKAEYVDASGHKVGALVSEDLTLSTTPVPEAAPTVLLGMALLGVGVVCRSTLLQL